MSPVVAELRRGAELSRLYVGRPRREARTRPRTHRPGARGRTQKRGLPRQHGLGAVQAEPPARSAGLRPEGHRSLEKGGGGRGTVQPPRRYLCRAGQGRRSARRVEEIGFHREERNGPEKIGLRRELTGSIAGGDK